MASSSQNNKRKRSPSTRSTEQNSSTSGDRSDTQAPKPFHVTHKVKNMESSLILTYIPDLPVNTQFFDLHELLTARKDDGAYWATSLDTWRQASLHTRRTFELLDNVFDHPPEITPGPLARPLRSSRTSKLRASLTYHQLLERTLQEVGLGRPYEQLLVEVAKKTMDYLMLSYMFCTQDEIEHCLPEHVQWFEDAVDIVERYADPGSRSRPSGHCLQSPFSSQTIDASQKAAASPRQSLDIDRLIESMKMSILPVADPMKGWDQIAGNAKAKWLLYESLVLALKAPRRYKMANVLLFGPTGTGKTMMVLCMAQFSRWTVSKVTSDVVLQSYQGESDKIIAKLFEQAKQSQPAIIFIDEVEYIMSKRNSKQSERASSIKCKLLSEMSDIMADKIQRVIVVATTNLPTSLDDSFHRRFECIAYVGLPDRGSIYTIMKQQLTRYTLAADVKNERLNELATRLQSRKLSGFEVTRALDGELSQLLRKQWFDATHFREEVSETGGKKLFVAGSDEPNAFRCKYVNLTEEQMDELVLRDANMADIQHIRLDTVALATDTTMREFQDFDKQRGTRVA